VDWRRRREWLGRGGRWRPGIPAEHLPHVFERFYKADRAYQPCSGPGLAIALENARLLGGMISVASAVGHGSVFRLTLPLGADSSVSER
jgi:two-component system sensor histidine kinase MtrB